MDGSEELLRVQIQAGFAVDGITMFNFPIAISEYPFAIRMKRHTFRFAQKTESITSGKLRTFDRLEKQLQLPEIGTPES